MEQAAAQFDRGVAALDQVRAMQMAEGVRLESAKGAIYAREHARLQRKYGADHPRTKEAASRASASKEYRAELAVEYRHAATPHPDPGSGWGVDGFVRTSDGTPVAGVTVGACDRQGRWHQDLGYACTNEQGYFQLHAATLPEKEMRVYMRAFDRGQALDSNENRLVPSAGRGERIEIILARSGTGDCTPPEGRLPSPPAPPAAPQPEAPTPATEATTGRPASGPKAEAAVTATATRATAAEATAVKATKRKATMQKATKPKVVRASTRPKKSR